jgi:hypothetical protein
MRTVKQKFGSQARELEDNIKTSLVETGWMYEMDWFRVVSMASFGNTVTKFLVS